MTPTTSSPQGEGFKYPAYAMAPVGIGPYKLEKYDEANKTVTLVANDAYYGDQPKTAKLVFKIIPDESTRRQELQAGSIDGYDLPEPRGLEGSGGRGQQGRGPPGVQHPLHGPEPQEEPEAEGPQGPAGHLPRAQP